MIPYKLIAAGQSARNGKMNPMALNETKRLTILLPIAHIVNRQLQDVLRGAMLTGVLAIAVAVAAACSLLGSFLMELSILPVLAIYAVCGAATVLGLVWARLGYCPTYEKAGPK